MLTVVVNFTMFNNKHQNYDHRRELNKQMITLNEKKLYGNGWLTTNGAKLRQALADVGYIASVCQYFTSILKNNFLTKIAKAVRKNVKT